MCLNLTWNQTESCLMIKHTNHQCLLFRVFLKTLQMCKTKILSIKISQLVHHTREKQKFCEICFCVFQPVLGINPSIQVMIHILKCKEGLIFYMRKKNNKPVYIDGHKYKKKVQENMKYIRSHPGASG